MNPISKHMVGDEVGVGGQEELEPGKEGLLWNILGWPKISFGFSCKPCMNLLSKPILLIPSALTQVFSHPIQKGKRDFTGEILLCQLFSSTFTKSVAASLRIS